MGDQVAVAIESNSSLVEIKAIMIMGVCGASKSAEVLGGKKVEHRTSHS